MDRRFAARVAARSTPGKKIATVAELNARLNAARDDDRRAVSAQPDAYELKRSLAANNPDGSMAIPNTNLK
jgi:hypothetical protein